MNYWKTVRGNSDNDIFVAGAYGEVLHFNGETWQLTQFSDEIEFCNIHIVGDNIIIGGKQYASPPFGYGIYLTGQRTNDSEKRNLEIPTGDN